MNNKIKNGKTTRLGVMSVSMSVIVVAVVIVINLIIGQLPSIYTKLDTSSNDMYSIGDISREIIADVDSRITMYLIAETGDEDTILLELMNRYAALNSNIKVETVDPIVRPSFTSAYIDADETLSSNSIIVESSKRSTVIDYSTIYMYDTELGELTYEEYVMYYQYYQLEGTQCFYGEVRITAAIDYVQTDNLPKIYTLSNHGESALDTGYSSYFEDENFILESLELLKTEAVPDDCDLLLINIPTADISSDEATMISDYLDRGGKIVLVTYFDYYSAEKMPNLASIANKMGLSSADGVVCESNRNNYYRYANYLLPDIGSGGFLEDTSFTVLVANAHGIVTDADSGARFNELLATTTGAYLKKSIDASSSLSKADGDIEGQYLLGVISTMNYGEENESQLMWFSSPSIVQDNFDQASAYGNSKLFMAAISNMCGKESGVSIIAKGMQVTPLQISSTQSILWGIVIIGVLPLGVIGGGLAIWLGRRRK